MTNGNDVDTSYCGVGVTGEFTENGFLIQSISPDSDLARTLMFEGLESIGVGDLITGVTEGGFRRDVPEYGTLRGPAGSIVTLHFIPSEEIDSPIAFERNTLPIRRKPFTGGYDNRLDPDGPKCHGAFVEVNPEEIMNSSPPLPQFASLPSQACYKS